MSTTPNILHNPSWPPVARAQPRSRTGGTDQPQRVLFVAACPFPCSRGTPARILGQATALHRLGIDVHVVTYHLHDAPHLEPFDGYKFYYRVKRGPKFDWVYEVSFQITDKEPVPQFRLEVLR